MEHNNQIKVRAGSATAGLQISSVEMKQVISATNNRAQYFADLAKKYRDEAKQHRDNAKYYAEQNSDVTFEYIDSVKAELTREINKKQELGDYALNSDIPQNVSELNNDSEYVNKTELSTAISEVELPLQENCEGKFLMSDGENEKWVGINTFKLFDTKISDHLLEGEETLGWALQGTYVSKSVYPDFYDKCLAEKEAGILTEVSLDGNTLSMYVHSNGHQYYDISNKEIIDSWYLTYGSAWFYGVDAENERIFLPRQNLLNLTDKSIIPVVGTGKVLGLTDGTNTYGTKFNNGSAYDGIVLLTGYVGQNVSTSNPGIAIGSEGINGSLVGLSTDSSNSGIEANLAGFKDEAKYLYICVGNSIVNQSLVDVAQLSSEIQYKVERDLSNCTKPYITETYKNGTSWYRVWSDGYIEQGGVITATSTGKSLTLLKSFSDTNYGGFVQHSVATYKSDAGAYEKSFVINTSSTATIYSGIIAGVSVRWIAYGY